MADNLEQQRIAEARAEMAKTPERPAAATPEYDEAGLEKLTEQAGTQVETKQADVLSTADKRIEAAPASIGLDKAKAESIFTSGGFAERVKNAKDRIATLTKNAKEKIGGLISQRAETKQPSPDAESNMAKTEARQEDRRPKTLEQYMERKPTGLEAAKEKARLAQLKLQGVKNPEKVLALAHYLEETAVESDSKNVKFEKTQTDKITKESEKLRKQGFEVSVHDSYSDDKNTEVWGSKETPYSFNAGESKWLSKDLDEMAKSPNDPVRVFEALRDNGYKLDVRKGWTFHENDKMKELFQNPDALAFLEKVKTFGGSSVTHDYLKDYDSLRYLSERASRDASEHIFTPEAEKGIEKVSALLGKPVKSSNVETWAQLSQDETAMEILTQLRQSDQGKDADENSLIHELNTVKENGIEKEVAGLFKDGFTKKSFGKLYGYGESNSKHAAKEIKSAAEAFKANPQLHQLVRGADKIFGMEEPLAQENMGRLKELAEKVPEAGPAFANMAEIGVHANRWDAGEALGNPERTAKYKKVLEAVAEPEFKVFASACEKAGYKFTIKDFFNDYPDSNRLIANYRDETFRSAISSESGVALAKHLGILEKPANEWNGWALRSLSQIPDAMSSLKKLEESYGYKYNPNDDYGNYQLGSLAGVLRNPELSSQLFEPQTVQTIGKARAEFGLDFPLHKAEELIKVAKDPAFRDALQNPDTVAFVKSGLTERNTDFETVTVLAKCDPKLRPAIEKMIKDFEYQPSSKHVNRYEYDEAKQDYINKYDLVLADTDKFQELQDNPKIFEAQQKLEAAGLKKNPLENINDFKKIAENDLFGVFEQCKNSPKIQEFLWRNLDTAVTVSKISPEKINTYLEIFQKIDDSPSQEIQRLKDSLLSQLLESQHPVEDYQKIESIFIKNNIPTMGKVYGVFETLHDPKNLEQKIGHKTSPVLKGASTRKRYYTIYQDMLKVHIESGNRSMKEYAEVLQRGGQLIEQYERSGLESLNPRQQEELRYFVGKLETLQAKSALDTADDAFKAADMGDLQERINHVREGLKVAEGQTVLERVSDMYLRPAGLKSMDELLERMHNSKNSADQRGRQMIAEARQKAGGGDVTLDLKGGDFLKGVDARYIGNILQNGSVAKEFLGASSDSDATPLDTDISLVKPEDAEGGFTNSINTSIAKDYGEIIFALKDRGQYQHTTIDQPAKAEAGKMELFQTGVLGERHYGIRTGFPTTEIDFMIAKENLTSRPKDLEKLFFEIAQNGYYTPVADTSGKVIFTPEMYDEYRKSFAGLEKFDAPALEYQPTTANERSYAKVSEIAAAIPEDSKRVDQATQVIRGEIEQALGGLGVSLRPEFDTSILGADLLDTGSTGRHTNTPGDFDFDFSLKLDAKDFPRSAELAQAIKGMMTFTEDNSHQEAGGYYQLRVKGVTSIGGQQLEKPLDIDIGFASKSDLSVYGSHDAIRDKLNYIKNHNGQQAYEQTIANVILTKQTLKEGHAYKKQEDGGFGGVGVENWILANGGSMENAFNSFRNAAYENGQRLPYERFKEKYRLLDPGTNIKFQSHDNFIDVLKPEGYEKMLNTIDSYLNRQTT